jgi:hypothetical protein
VARGARPNRQVAVVVARRQMADGVAGRDRAPASDAAAVQVAAVLVVVVVRVAAPVEAVVGPVAMEAGMPAATTIVAHLGAGQ